MKDHGQTIHAGKAADFETFETLRRDFSILSRSIHEKPLVYLDSGATTLKPTVVTASMMEHMNNETSNVHRGVHYLSEQATLRFESARQTVANFIGAKTLTPNNQEVVFTSGTTMGLNILARSLSLSLKPGDEILISEMEHHSNIVPWQLFCKERGAVLKKIPLMPRGDLDLDAYEQLLQSGSAKIVAVTMLSNAIGTVNPLKVMTAMAHRWGAKVVVDAAQAVAHGPIDVLDLDVDFLVFSGHKLYGPTGIGVIYGKSELMAKLPPAIGGGGMIRSVTIQESSFAPPPARFEAGTPPIAEAIGLAKAIEYIQGIGFDAIEAYESYLDSYARVSLEAIDGLRILGAPQKHKAIFSFTLQDIHPHDIGTILDQEGVAIRSGHHCCQPLMNYYQVPATSRASLGLYNSVQDIDRLCAAIQKVKEIFG